MLRMSARFGELENLSFLGCRLVTLPTELLIYSLVGRPSASEHGICVVSSTSMIDFFLCEKSSNVLDVPA